MDFITLEDALNFHTVGMALIIEAGHITKIIDEQEEANNGKDND